MLSEALESIMVQTHPPSEVVVSDNVADSATAAVVASFASRSNFPVRLIHCRYRNSLVENYNNAVCTVGLIFALVCDTRQEKQLKIT